MDVAAQKTLLRFCVNSCDRLRGDWREKEKPTVNYIKSSETAASYRLNVIANGGLQVQISLGIFTVAKAAVNSIPFTTDLTTPVGKKSYLHVESVSTSKGLILPSPSNEGFLTFKVSAGLAADEEISGLRGPKLEYAVSSLGLKVPTALK